VHLVEDPHFNVRLWPARTHTYTYTHAHTHTRMHIHIHACTYTYTNIHVGTYTHIHIHTHLHTHTHTRLHSACSSIKLRQPPPSANLQILHIYVSAVGAHCAARTGEGLSECAFNISGDKLRRTPLSTNLHIYKSMSLPLEVACRAARTGKGLGG